MQYDYNVVPNKINFNERVMHVYLNKILPRICEDGDDFNYGSAATCDIAALQAISKRIHFGKFVAESKFQQSRAKYSDMIQAGDGEAILETLTNQAVEDKLLKRVFDKAIAYGRDLTAGVPELPADDEGECKFRVEPEAIVSLYKDILIPLTKQVQVQYLLQRLRAPRVAFLGPAGSFSHQAAREYFGACNADVECLPQKTFAGVFHAVMSNEVLFGIIPTENSVGGKVHQVLGHLTGGPDSDAMLPTVTGDWYLKVRHCVLTARPDVQLADIRRVYSHPQGFAQCNRWLRTHLPGVEHVETRSTSHAGELVKEQGGGDCAAIGSDLLASAYGLHVLQRDVHDDNLNETRFFCIRKDSLRPVSVAAGNDRTVVLFGLKNQAGSLASVLAIFAANGVNLSTIESVKSPGKPWEYNFFLEMEGHVTDAAVKASLDESRQFTLNVRVLGSFQTSNTSSS